MEAAKKVTGKSNETEAIREFRQLLDSPDNYFNKVPFPSNESDAQAHARCSTIEGAKNYCPMRWKAIQGWFNEARMVKAASAVSLATRSPFRHSSRLLPFFFFFNFSADEIAHCAFCSGSNSKLLQTEEKSTLICDSLRSAGNPTIK